MSSFVFKLLFGFLLQRFVDGVERILDSDDQEDILMSRDWIKTKPTELQLNKHIFSTAYAGSLVEMIHVSFMKSFCMKSQRYRESDSFPLFIVSFTDK